MAVGELQVLRFTDETFASTKASWLASAVKLDMPTLDYEIQLDWAEKHMSYAESNGDSLAYGIFAPDGSVPALVEIVYSRRAGPDIGWLKMLSIKLSPEFAPSETDANAEKLATVARIYSASIIGTVKLTGSHQARVVKLYGRDNTLLSLLVGIKDVLSSNLGSEAFKVSLEGRWLVIATV